MRKVECVTLIIETGYCRRRTTECLPVLGHRSSGDGRGGSVRRGFLRAPALIGRSAIQPRQCWRLRASGDRHPAAPGACMARNSGTTCCKLLPSRTTPTCCHISALHFLDELLGLGRLPVAAADRELGALTACWRRLRELFPHVLGRAGSIDQPFQQRIAGQPIRSVHAGAGDFAGGVQSGQRGLSRRGRCARRPWRNARPGESAPARWRCRCCTACRWRKSSGKRLRTRSASRWVRSR